MRTTIKKAVESRLARMAWSWLPFFIVGANATALGRLHAEGRYGWWFALAIVGVLLGVLAAYLNRVLRDDRILRGVIDEIKALEGFGDSDLWAKGWSSGRADALGAARKGGKW